MERKDRRYRPPLSVSRTALLQRGSDEAFRRLIDDLFSLAARFQDIREGFGALAALSGAQYSILMTIARLQGLDGVAVNRLADRLHVSGAFVTAETGKLARRGLIAKRTNPRDRRGVLITLTPAGRQLIDQLGPTVRAVNDVIFRDLDPAQFEALQGIVGRMVEALGDAQALQRRMPTQARLAQPA